MRLIDADAYKALHCKECPSDCGVCGLVYGKDDMCGLIDRAPTIDAVPVVRCKDCIRRYDTDECPMCFLIEGNYCEYTNENGYCDRGERKEGVE